MSHIITHGAVFFFIYSVQFVESPGGVGTRAWFGLIGFFYLIFHLVTNMHHKKINPHIRVVGLLLFFLVFLSFISISFNSTSDFAFVAYAPSMLAVAFSAFFVAQVVRYASPGNYIFYAKNVFINVVGVQLCIALMMFLLPDIGFVLNDIQISDDFVKDVLVETGEFRLSGFGARFFGAGIVNSYALILIVSLVRSVNLSFMRIVYFASMFVFVVVFGMMMSRTTLVGAGLALGFLMLPLSVGQPKCQLFKMQRKFFLLLLLVVPMMLIAFAMVFVPEFISDIEPALKFGMELFVNYFEGGRLESDSTTQLLNMYDIGQDLPLIIGDGHYVDPQDSSQYYKSIDVGYIRLIYYFGIPGLLVYALFQFQAILMSAEGLESSERYMFIAVCFSLVLFLNLKGFADIFVFSFYLYACALGRKAFF